MNTVKCKAEIEIIKETFTGSADSGKVPAKIFTIAVGTVHNRRRSRMGLTATIMVSVYFSLIELNCLIQGCGPRSKKILSYHLKLLPFLGYLSVYSVQYL